MAPKTKAPPAEPFKVGDLVYITPAGHEWITRSNKFPGLNISGRTAQVIEVYDWKTEKGKELLEKRKETGKWSSLKSEDFRYIVLIFYPDLSFEEKVGVMHPEMLCLNHPKMDTPTPLFSHYPKHLLEYVKGDKVLRIDQT